MNFKNCISYVALFTMILSMSNCKITQVSKLDDFSFLNGKWKQPCDSLLTGEYKGEVECVMLEEDATFYAIHISGSKGFLVRDLLRSKDTTLIAFKYNNEGGLILENQSKDERWQRGVHQVDSATIKLYAKDSSSIEFFRRKR